jgi:hypothetical protein
MIETFEDRNVTAAVCRSTPNGMNTLNTQIDNCTTTTELSRNQQFAGSTVALQKDIEMLQAAVGDSLIMGDSIFGKFGVADITHQVKARNEELKTKKENLRQDIDKKEAIIERSNRDFTDVKDSLPEKQPKRVLHFIEDYTVAFVIIAYLFMVLAGIYLYTINSTLKIIGFIKALIGSIFLSCFFFMVFMYLS